MAKVASVIAFMVLLAVIVEGRDWRFKSVKRVKRGYNPGTYGHGDKFGKNDERNGGLSKERMGTMGCSEEQGGGSFGSGSHELSFNRDNRPSDRRHRSFTKSSATASASAVAFNKDQKTNL
ncbi:hypothetical protein PYW07_006915 [Mythimna separata]|uniref:Uncharacterized protein n=1 Tax=Mythimna separata TaxID=271217 RepID=A0AAD8E062_MYTSE|nr:hypothetical protein PYW07_006915 [Mythimna separata]